MLFRHVRDLCISILVCAMVNGLSDDTKYYEIEKNEKKVEYDNSPTAALPDAETYVIGVKRALLPFRQLSKYLRKPVAGPGVQMKPNSSPGIQWRVPLSEPDEFGTPVKTRDQKRWDRDEMDSADVGAETESVFYPEIILIKPVNVTKLSASKISNIQKNMDEAIRSRQKHEEIRSDDEPHCPHTQRCPRRHSSAPEPIKAKNTKIENQIYQGNGINIKLSFSVDMGNQTADGKTTTVRTRRISHHHS